LEINKMDSPSRPVNESKRLSNQFVQGLFRMLENWNVGTAEHSRRVARYTVQLAREMGWHDQDLVRLEWGALLHDIGKVCIPASILVRQGALSEEEWTVVKRHPIFGYELLHPIETMELTAGVIAAHHENWDGSGYPNGTRGEAIPPGARIVAVAEVWDALTSDPEDCSHWPKSKVIQYIRTHSTAKFDPAVVNAFLQITGEI
jgi:putative nucleotidyltransferase with HDIG domain